LKPKPKFLGPEYASQFSDRAVATVYRKRPPYPAELFAQLAALVPDSNRSLLDVGAGTGEIAIPMSSYAESVDAVEPSAAMLAVARQQPGHNQVTWHNLSGEDFGYPERYGMITCAQCLGWMDWEIVFPKFSKALTADGWLVVVDQDALTELSCQQELSQLIARYSTNQDYEPFNLINGLIDRELFDRHGSSTTSCVPFAQSIDYFIDSIHGRNGFSRDRMAPAAAIAFDRAADALLRRTYPSGMIHGSCRATMTWGHPGIP
jgi:SAM-dependent methyltransferase